MFVSNRNYFSIANHTCLVSKNRMNRTYNNWLTWPKSTCVKPQILTPCPIPHCTQLVAKLHSLEFVWDTGSSMSANTSRPLHTSRNWGQIKSSRVLRVPPKMWDGQIESGHDKMLSLFSWRCQMFWPPCSIHQNRGYCGGWSLEPRWKYVVRWKTWNTPSELSMTTSSRTLQLPTGLFPWIPVSCPRGPLGARLRSASWWCSTM